MPDQTTHLTVTDQHGVCIVEFTDRKILEELSIQEIEQELMELVNSRVTINLLLSFRMVEHLSSAALGMLINVNKAVAEKEGQLKLSDIRSQIYHVFKVTKLDRMFDIYDSTSKALAAF